jgi:hypothetical protein
VAEITFCDAMPCTPSSGSLGFGVCVLNPFADRTWKKRDLSGILPLPRWGTQVMGSDTMEALGTGKGVVDYFIHHGSNPLFPELLKPFELH